MTGLLIKGGVIVDGSGAPAFRGDVRVAKDRIVEVGDDLSPYRERVIDAKDTFVIPGIIEGHSHYDAGMWWDARLDPLPAYGTTTTLIGHCGLSVCPMSADDNNRREMIDVFSFLEDIPLATFEAEMAFDWSDWSEYKAALKKRRITTNVGAFVGHLNLRIAVMGNAAWERPATAEERARLAAVLDEALSAGALGLSTNLLDADRLGRPVPSRLADDAEYAALADVMMRHPRTALQFIPDAFRNKSNATAHIERLARIFGPRKIRMHHIGVTIEHRDAGLLKEVRSLHERLLAEGVDSWLAVPHFPAQLKLGFESGMMFGFRGITTWNEAVHAPLETKRSWLSDPEWRAKARQDWDGCTEENAPMAKPERMIFRDSETGKGPLGISLKDYARGRGEHPSDALAHWVLENGAKSNIQIATPPVDETAIAELLKADNTFGNLSDAGAHGQIFCGAGQSCYLLTHYVRGTAQLTIEEAVKAITGNVAKHYRLADRGLIAPGMYADLAVFALDEIEERPEERVYDVPDGRGGLTWRYTRAAAPFRATIVNGVETFKDGAYTGNLPGQFVGSM